MKNTSQAELLSAVEDLAKLYPQWRMGQLISNVAGWVDQEIWDIEDDQLLSAIRRHLKQREEARASPSS